jgi:iron complex outermembrane receptor protein
MKLKSIARAAALLCMVAPVLAQEAAPQRVEITGSSIKRIREEGALPVQVISRQDLERQGIVTAEQVIASLSINGNGLDNLAANADVVSGAARGNNGSSSANLRGQGAASTLVLLNGRRVAAHGLNGGVVDLNSIPMAAVDRIEILKDGASAIYGTDAIGGVINFILRKDFAGLEAQAFTDITEAGGGNIARARLTGGWGNLERDRFNVLVALSLSATPRAARRPARLRQHLPARAAAVGRHPRHAVCHRVRDRLAVQRVEPRQRQQCRPRHRPHTTGHHAGHQRHQRARPARWCRLQLDRRHGRLRRSAVGLPGREVGLRLGHRPRRRAAAAGEEHQRLVARGTLALGEHRLALEFVGGKSESAKSFSANQISSSTSTSSPFYNLAYPSTGASYNAVFNALVGTFPTIEANRGRPLAFRWRCMPCGNRADRHRERHLAPAAVGRRPAGRRLGLPRRDFQRRQHRPVHCWVSGYFYGKEFAALLNTGVLNPFLPAGQSQTPEALAALAATSANGVTLYGGKYTLQQADAVATGPLFKLPAGDAMAAVGLDMRTEKYRFNGNETDLETQRRIFNAPFDSINSLDTVKRDVKAVFTEVMLPVTKNMEVTLAARYDDYTGFGSTTNPKVSLRCSRWPAGAARLVQHGLPRAHLQPAVLRHHRVHLQRQGPGRPGALRQRQGRPGGAGLRVDHPGDLHRRQAELGPEESKQWTGGFVWAPSADFSIGADWWSIRRTAPSRH